MGYCWPILWLRGAYLRNHSRLPAPRRKNHVGASGTHPYRPEATTRVARAAFPKGDVYVQTRDELGTVFDDTSFAGLFPEHGWPAEAPWQLALVTA
jgi:hypothetical protein